jgi:hypothetical protein
MATLAVATRTDDAVGGEVDRAGERATCPRWHQKPPLASAALPSVLGTLAEQRVYVASTARAVERCVGLVVQLAHVRQAKMVST